jgi:hypothetical protein
MLTYYSGVECAGRGYRPSVEEDDETGGGLIERIDETGDVP